MNNPQQVIQTIMQIIQSGNNPETLINSLANQNPQIRALLNQKQQSNMSWKDLTLQLAKQNNVNLTPYIQGLSQRGIKL